MPHAGWVFRRMPHWLVCLLVVVASQFAAGQAVVNSGTVRGLVSDSSGAAIVGASVSLISRPNHWTSTRTSNSAGIYLFASQTVGLYAVEVSAPGFRKQVVEPVLVQVGQTTSVNVRLQAGGESESVTVIGESPLLRAEDTDVSSVISRHLLDELPLSGRRFLDFALLVPNATPDGEQGLVSFAGEQGGQDTGYANANGANSFSVDGANATSNYFGGARGGERVPYIFGESAIQEFQVAQSPYRAEFGGAATGFVNAVTRSGSDDMHGGAFYYNRNSGTGANDAVNKANGIPRPTNILQQFGGRLGGAIKPRRAWYFVDYEQQRQKNPMSVINPAFANVEPEDFGVEDDVVLPPPNGPLPLPGESADPDPDDPAYLQQVSNALNAIRSNLGVSPRFRNDWALFSKLDYRDVKDDRFYLSLNWNRFDSPHGAIVGNETPLFGLSTLASAYVRDYHAAIGWSHAYGSNLLNEVRASFSRDDQYFNPTGLVDPVLPAILLISGDAFEVEEGGALQLGNAGFAGGRTNESQWQISDRVSYLRGRHTFKFGVEFSRTHLADLAFGGFDPDALRQNGTFRGTYNFSSLKNFAVGRFDTFFQNFGNQHYSFNVPYIGFYLADTYKVHPRLTLDFGVREDFQIYPQPQGNPAFPLTGQFPNQYQRLAPRIGFAWQPQEKTVVRGGFGMFYENLNGLNYRNSVVSNGLPTQQVSAQVTYDPNLDPDEQAVVFPNQISNPTALPNISLVDPNFKFPYILQGSLQIEREVLPDTVVTLGTTWTHGVHLIASSAYDMNLVPPTGTTTYILCDPGAEDVDDECTGRQLVLPNLDSAMLQEHRISNNFEQINALISPGLNNYNSFFVQGQRRLRKGLAFQAAYTFSKNIQSRGVDFNNQFDFRNTHAPYLLDQRHRVTVAAVYEPDIGRSLHDGFLRALASDWSLSTVMQFASGRPYAALLDPACPLDEIEAECDIAPESGLTRNIINNTAALQSTANSALGINGAGPSPLAGLNAFYGPWTQQIDLGLARRFHITERQTVSLHVQAFNLLNHANYYVQNGNGVNQTQYRPFGDTCGDGHSTDQLCGLVLNSGENGFGSLQRINALNGPRVLQFAVKYNF